MRHSSHDTVQIPAQRKDAGDAHRAGGNDAAGGGFWQVRLPQSLLCLLLTVVGLFVATQFRVYGRTWDEGLQDWYGEAVLRWYRSAGADLSFLAMGESLHMPQHGPFFEVVVAVAQHLLEPLWGAGDHWYIRALVCGVAGALGIAGMALCGFELGRWWGAFLAAAGLAVYPRYTGAIFNNSKDIPLAVGMIFILWATMRLVRRWDSPRYLWVSAVLGLLIGATVSVRINAMVWYGVLGAAAVLWWLRHGPRSRRDGTWRAALRRQVRAGALIGVVSYLTMVAVWPYIALNPVDGLIDSIAIMSRYDWNGIIPFEGQMIHAFDLPRRYAPVWLVAGSPLATVLLGLLGLHFIGADLVRRRLPDAPVLLAAALFVVPLTAIVVLRPTLYNGPRHFLFVVPGLVLLGTVGLLRLWTLLLRRRQRLLAGGLAAVLLALTGDMLVEAGRLYPFEYMYFSPVVGGYVGAKDKYEYDYWGTCQTPAVQWLSAHHGRYRAATTPPKVAGLFDHRVVAHGRPLADGPSDAADFYISNVYSTVPPGYTKVYAAMVHGIELCTVNVRR